MIIWQILVKRKKYDYWHNSYDLALVADRHLFTEWLVSVNHHQPPFRLESNFATYNIVLVINSAPNPLTTPHPSPLCRIYASVNWVTNGSDNGLSPTRRQAIIQTNAVLVSIGPSETNISEFVIKIQTFHSRECIWKCRLGNGGHFSRGKWVKSTKDGSEGR